MKECFRCFSIETQKLIHYQNDSSYPVPPTIKDVAKKAGVALSTVSLVINDRPNVAPGTKARVRRAIEELNYHPRRSAQTLASHQTGNIGFILTEDHFSNAEPFYTKIFLGTEFKSRDHNFYVLLTTVPNTFRPAVDTPRFLRERNVDGVVLAGRVPVSLCKQIHQLDLPHVYVDYAPPGRRGNVVLMDNHRGALLAMQHLFDLGHRRIAFIGGELSHPSIQDRFDGYKSALAEAGIPIDANMIHLEQRYTTVPEGYQATRALLEKGVSFTALFAANDAMAIGAMQCLKEHGMTIPREVSVVGYDDVEASAHSEPPLTTVHVEKEGMGAIAIRRLVEMIRTKKKLVGTVYTPVELVVRQTTAPVAPKSFEPIVLNLQAQPERR